MPINQVVPGSARQPLPTRKGDRGMCARRNLFVFDGAMYVLLSDQNWRCFLTVVCSGAWTDEIHLENIIYVIS